MGLDLASPRRRRLAAAAVASFGAFLCALILTATGFGQLAESRSLDLRFRARGQRQAAPEIVILAVDEASFNTLGLRYPFPPKVWAQLVDYLAADGAGAVGFDFLYSEPSRECDPPGQDEMLSQAVRRAGNVVWAFQLQDGTKPDMPIAPIAEASARLGFINLPDERDSRIRRYAAEAVGHSSFASALAEVYAGFRPPEAQGEILRVIAYRGGPGTFPSRSLGDTLTGKVPKGFFSGKIVLVGATFASGHDVYPTPFHRTDQADMAGVEIHANILAGILAGRVVSPDPPLLQWLAAVGIAFLIAWAVCAGRPAWAAGFWLLATISWAGWSLFRFSTADRAALLVGPLLVLSLAPAAGLVWSYFSERERRRAIRNLFAHYLDPKVVSWLERHPEDAQLSDQRRVCTILDTDIEGFTTITHAMDPAALVAHLNDYFEVLTKCAMEHGGLVDKYVGDAVMVIFGFPLDQPDHAMRAVATAKAFLYRLDSMSVQWKKRGLPPLRTRVGIATGEVVVGNVGGTVRKTFTAMGDAANLASRLEALNKQFGTRVLLSEATAKSLPNTVQLFAMGEVAVRGLATSEKVYCPDFGVPDGGVASRPPAAPAPSSPP